MSIQTLLMWLLTGVVCIFTGWLLGPCVEYYGAVIEKKYGKKNKNVTDNEYFDVIKWKENQSKRRSVAGLIFFLSLAVFAMTQALIFLLISGGALLYLIVLPLLKWILTPIINLMEL